ncbi:hypothetical protein [Nocardioides limicola]|uniref:hypothetical protein n=1 Tax=Nocardioides limicola TaxID=2803368 RepID=UPI00193C4AAE|nr:hypothetical protein [Nocardioides sp. DJM-14]
MSPDLPDGIMAEHRPIDVTGTDLSVQVPGGRIGVTIGEPVPHINRPNDRPLTPKRDRAFLPVKVFFERERRQHPLSTLLSTDESVATLSLRIGEYHYELGQQHVNAYGLRQSHYLHIHADPEAETEHDLELSVEFAGVTQRVDTTGHRDTGLAQVLYDTDPAYASLDCRDDGWGHPQASAYTDCLFFLARHPYSPTLGWAQTLGDDYTWVTLQTDMRVRLARFFERPDDVTDDVTGLFGRACQQDPRRPSSTTLRLDGQPMHTDVSATTNDRPETGNPGDELAQALTRLLGQPGPTFLARTAPSHDLEISTTFNCLDAAENPHSLDYTRTFTITW